MGETAPTTEHPDHAADLETTALHPAPSVTRFPGGPPIGDPRLRRVAVSALLAGLAILLAVATPLHQAVWPLMAPNSAPTVIISAQLTPTDVLPIEWSALRDRPLYLPMMTPGAACPISPVHNFHPAVGPGLDHGPVYPFSFTPDGQPMAYDPPRQTASGLVPGFTKLEWAIAPTVGGGVLVRGAQLDGQHPVAFNGGYAQRDYQGNWANAPLLGELQLVVPIAPIGESGEWIYYDSYVRLEAPGCYSFQVDGRSFSYILVFLAGV